MAGARRSRLPEILRPRPPCQFVRGYPGRWTNLSKRIKEAGPEGKAALWEEIKEKAPGLADLLKDKRLWELQRAFDGEIHVEEYRERQR